ncbi:MAG: hypothetical protein SPG23_08145, partial [Agathobacter sp.]|nr:hypothetical protein [Agathobacter sp.]
MATTRLIALHVNKSKGASASMHERLAKEAGAQMDHLLSDIKQKRHATSTRHTGRQGTAGI